MSDLFGPLITIWIRLDGKYLKAEALQWLDQRTDAASDSTTDTTRGL